MTLPISASGGSIVMDMHVPLSERTPIPRPDCVQPI